MESCAKPAWPLGSSTCVGAGRRFVVMGTASTLLASSLRPSGDTMSAGLSFGSSGNSTSQTSPRRGNGPIALVLVPCTLRLRGSGLAPRLIVAVAAAAQPLVIGTDGGVELRQGGGVVLRDDHQRLGLRRERHRLLG